VISTVTSKGTMRWKIFEGVLNSHLMIDFMKRLVRDLGAQDLPDPGSSGA